MLPRPDVRHLGLGFAIAVIAALTGLMLIFADAAKRAEVHWQSQIAGSLSVIIPAGSVTDPAEAATTAADVLMTIPGVLMATPMPQDQAEALLQPWFGAKGIETLPIPTVVELETDPGAPPTLEAITRTLKDKGIDALVDDYGHFKTTLARMSGAIRTLTYSAFLALVLTAAALSAFAALSGISTHRHIVDVMHLVGARDSVVAQVFERRYAKLVFKAAALGAGLALVASITIAIIGGHDPFAPSLRLTFGDVVRLVLIPPALALVALVSTRIAALHALSKLS